MTRRSVLGSLRWIPNALSLFRAVVVALIIVVVYLDHFSLSVWLAGHPQDPPTSWQDHRYWCLALVAAGALTDWLDGALARGFAAYGWSTDLGKTIDTAGDKTFGLATLYVAVPIEYGAGWYLVCYVPALAYVAYYSWMTTAMRKRGEIVSPNWTAKAKTALLMAVAVIAFANAAFGRDNEVILWCCVVGTGLAALMCRPALRQYRLARTQSTVRTV